jgi:transcriptional regulator GlxA family with amidase domain
VSGDDIVLRWNRFGELGCYGGRDVPTPHLDALAKNGVRFTDAYVTAPFCAASRAGLLTGRRATTHWGALDLLESMDAGVKVERGLRVVDDGIISSAGVASGIDMSFHVVETLFGKAVADETAHYIEYRRETVEA